MFTRLALAFSLLATPAAAHDIYLGLHDGFDDTGMQTFQRDIGKLCCGGDPETGDCEAMDGYEVTPVGKLFAVYSNRYKRWVLIAPEKVAWTGVAGSDRMVHWCGIPRSKMAYPANNPVSADNPDEDVHTFCIFIVPGGV